MKYLYLITAALFLMVACEKPKDGKSGISGSKVISGKGSPTMDLGAEGDYFIDTLTSVLWGPKYSTSWGSGIEMTGNTILNGLTDPTFSTGKLGDYYLNFAKKILYGPKNQFGWGEGTSLARNLTVSNFIYTPWQVTAGTTKDSIIDGTAAKIRYAYPKSLTTEILETGTMVTYMRFGSTVIPLPYLSFAGGKANTLNAYYGLKKVVIARVTENVSVAGDVIGMSSSLEYRHIFIPGNLVGQPAGEKTPQINGGNKVVQIEGINDPIDFRTMSYENVCNLLGIEP